MECRICRTDGWWDQQGHKILAWTQIVSRQSASLCSFNSEKFILCNLLLLQADIVDNVSLVYSLLNEHLLWHCVTTWALQRHMAGHVLVAGSSVEGLDRVVGPGRDHGTAWHLADPPCHPGPDRFSRWKCNLQGKTLPAYWLPLLSTILHYFHYLHYFALQKLCLCLCLMILVPHIVLVTTLWAINICPLFVLSSIHTAFSWHDMALEISWAHRL